MNNYYVSSQRIAERQSALTADLTQRAQLKDARAARKTAAANQPSRTRRLVFGRLVFRRPAHATA